MYLTSAMKINICVSFAHAVGRQVRDGYSRRSPLLLRHCGNQVPQPPTVVSTANWMYVRLKADGSHRAKGFLANYTMVRYAQCGQWNAAITGYKIWQYFNEISQTVSLTEPSSLVR